MSDWRRRAGMLVGVGLLASGVCAPGTLASDFDDKEPATIGLIEIDEPLRERRGPMSPIFTHAGGETLRSLIELIEKTAEDRDVNGLVIRIRWPMMSLAHVEELCPAIEKARAAGKKVHIFSEAYDTPTLMLGACADEVILQSGGHVSLPGLYSEEMYLADSLAWAGIKADLVQVGDYKGANEALVNSAPSKAWEQNINSLLDSMYGVMRDSIKRGRKMDDAQLDEAMRRAWIATDATAKEVKLVDTVMDLPQLNDHLEKSYEAPIEWSNIRISSRNAPTLKIDSAMDFMGALAAGGDNPKTSRDTIAILHIDGPIVDGYSSSGGFSGDGNVGSWTIRQALAQLEQDDNVQGVILRINSPGGSAIASEIIWQGVKRVAGEKPVWVSVGSMAASGGYYIAVSGDKIYANEGSILGSIGVVGGKISMSGLFEKLRVNTVGRGRGPMSGMLSSEPWTEDQRALVRTKMTETYDLFTRRVSAGRPHMDLAKTAEGRLFTGADAVKLSMADEIGGLDQAIEDMAKKLELAEDSYDVIDYPAPAPLGQVIGEFFGRAGAPGVAAGSMEQRQGRAMLFAAVREVVGERHWPQVSRQLEALYQLRTEPVVLTSPWAVMFRY